MTPASANAVIAFSRAATTIFAENGDGGMGDIGTKINTLFGDVRTMIETWISAAGIVAISICAVIYIFSSEPQTSQKAKSWGLRILIGLVFFWAASLLVNAMKAVGS